MESLGIWHILGLLIKVIKCLPCPCSEPCFVSSPEFWSRGTLWGLCVEGTKAAKRGPLVWTSLSTYPQRHWVPLICICSKWEFGKISRCWHQKSNLCAWGSLVQASRKPWRFLYAQSALGWEMLEMKVGFCIFLPNSCSRFLSPEDSIGITFT